MKKKILIVLAVIFLAATNLYAGPGDVYVEKNLGVGTTNPQGKLHTEDIIYDQGAGNCPSGYTEGDFDGEGDSEDCKAIGIVVKDNGNVGIGDTSPDGSLKLDVEGAVGASEYCDENGNNCTPAANVGIPTFGAIDCSWSGVADPDSNGAHCSNGYYVKGVKTLNGPDDARVQVYCCKPW